MGSSSAAKSSVMRGSPNGCTPMPTRAERRPDVAAEDLAHADLPGALGLILVADHPERDDRVGVVERRAADLDQAMVWREEPEGLLRLAHDGVRAEPVLADHASDRTGVDAGLQVGDAHFAVELRAPRLLVGLDAQ